MKSGDATFDVLVLEKGLLLAEVPDDPDLNGFSRLDALVRGSSVAAMVARHRFMPFESIASAKVRDWFAIKATIELRDGAGLRPQGTDSPPVASRRTATRCSRPNSTAAAKTSQVRKLSSCCWGAVCPGGVFVVEGCVAQAAVQDADEAVGQGAQGLVVGVAGGAVLVIERSGAGAGGQGAEGPLVDGVIEAAVADVAGQDGVFSARRDGQR